MTGRPTARQRNGTDAEERAAAYLAAAGWTILARNLRIGRDEIDILAVDPTPPATIVCVEVRSLAAGAFGAPEDGVDRHKVLCLYRAMSALRSSGTIFVEHLVGGAGAPWRVDLVTIDRRPGRNDVRHLRAVEPP